MRLELTGSHLGRRAASSSGYSCFFLVSNRILYSYFETLGGILKATVETYAQETDVRHTSCTHFFNIEAPITEAPITDAPTDPPTTTKPTTKKPTTKKPTTKKPTTKKPTTKKPVG
jgi:hypothetical protein